MSKRTDTVFHYTTPFRSEHLAAVDDIMIAVPDRGRLEVRDVAAAARLGDAERDDLLSAEHRRRDALFELVRAQRENRRQARSEEHKSELQSLMSSSYAVYCLKHKNKNTISKERTNK